MAEFVPNRVGHQLIELFHTLRHALVRILIDGDLIGEDKTIADPAQCEWPATVQPKQIWLRRLLFDDEYDVIEQPSKPARNSA